ncbi:hypothetical protein [Amycolatopsis anabasis]|uniref:hypothetical protein n=1 Tax=Amycolatopsis anabasis TaxID=1840409 RepID=UPI00131D495E|nr:hypothetical protein [Amycolatopsis anabasis]
MGHDDDSVTVDGRVPLFAQVVDLARQIHESGDAKTARAVEAAAISLRETYRHAPDLYPALETLRDDIDLLLRSARGHYVFNWPEQAANSADARRR